LGIIKDPIGGCDHDLHSIDGGMAQELLNAVSEDRLGADRLVLLRQSAAQPVASARGNNQGDGAGHLGRILPGEDHVDGIASIPSMA
jgi:hypothetical protein